jgi:hypothetical protein
MAGQVTVASDSSAPKFVLFPNLPLEIQDEIWVHVAHFKRIVDVRAQFIAQTESEESLDDDYKWNSCKKPPAMLHINHRARKIGLRYYHLRFGSEPGACFPGLQNSLPPTIYVNYSSDRLLPLGFFTSSDYTKLFESSNPGNVDDRPHLTALHAIRAAGLLLWYASIEQLVDHHGYIPVDIILYYSEQGATPLLSSGSVEFVKIPQAADAAYLLRAYRELKLARRVLFSNEKVFGAEPKRYLRSERNEDDEKVLTENIDSLTFGKTTISFRAVMIRLRTYPVGGLDTHRVGVPMGGLKIAITHPWVPISQPSYD